MSHAVTADSLDAAQARYNDLLPRQYMMNGVQQMQANTPSALSAGIAESPRTYTWAGERHVMGTGLGRSKSTYEANPVAGQVSD
jgi:hypothetical protein